MRSDYDFYYEYEEFMDKRRANRTNLQPLSDFFDKHYTHDEHWDCYQRATGKFMVRHSKVYSARKKKGRKYDYLSFHTYWGLMHKTARNRFEVTK